MSHPSKGPDSDRNLLFGILAVQVNFIGQSTLVAAMHTWVLDKTKPLGQILLEQGKLTAEQLHVLDSLLAEHLKAHGDDAERSLQAMNEVSLARSTRASVSIDAMEASLAKFESEASAAGEETGIYRPAPSAGVRYLRLRHHKDGGLGKLFLAEDTELHREVALKEIKAEYADDPESRGRFLLEAEITGGLEHPGIVPVYGLGAYPNGRPYYAMRFIRGDSLKDAIKSFHTADRAGRDPGERSLAFRQLLRRFVDVCNAVAYAHSRGVLHRDLKPANIMLGKFGETLVVDWGLAKAGIKGRDGPDHAPGAEEERTLRPSSGSSFDATRAGITLGTPPFMSPEQAAGRIMDLGPASDIFSLGSTLYVLLTGAKPFDATDHAELLAQVRKCQFPPPKQVKPQTPPALDAICKKAMALKPADRYATALELAADVEHWLADEPVAAYPEPWTVRAGRWSRRHRTALVGAAVFLVSAVVALAISTGLIWAEQKKTVAALQLAEENYQKALTQESKTAEQKGMAETNLELARTQLFNSIDLIEQSQVNFASDPALHAKRKGILTTAALACQQLLEKKAEDREMQKRAVQVYRFTANLHRLENSTQAAAPLYKEAIGLQERLANEFQATLAYRYDLADLFRDYSLLQVKQGQLREATVSINRSLDIVEQLRKAEPKHPGYRRKVALALLSLGNVEYRSGKNEQSEKTIKQSVDLLQALADGAQQDQHPYDPLLLAGALSFSAMIACEGGDLDAAVATHKQAGDLLTEMQKNKSKMVNDADVAHMMAVCRVEQSKTWAKLKTATSLPNAEKNLSAGITNLEKLARDFKIMPSYQESLAVAYRERGQVREQGKDFQQAWADYDKAHMLFAALVNKYADIPDLRGELGRSCAGLARIARELGRNDSAEWLKKAGVELGTAVRLSPDDTQLKQSLEALGKIAH